MNICVFGASSDVIEDKYIDITYKLGCEMAKRDMGLVFGGGNCGVMGASARGMYDNGGYILGVAPHFMKIHNLLFEKCTKFKHTETMAERKTYMEDHADAFIIAPGGIDDGSLHFEYGGDSSLNPFEIKNLEESFLGADSVVSLDFKDGDFSSASLDIDGDEYPEIVVEVGEDNALKISYDYDSDGKTDTVEMLDMSDK